MTVVLTCEIQIMKILNFEDFLMEAAYKAELFEIVEQNSFDFNDLNLSKGPAACTEKRAQDLCMCVSLECTCSTMYF